MVMYKIINFIFINIYYLRIIVDFFIMEINGNNFCRYK